MQKVCVKNGTQNEIKDDLMCKVNGSLKPNDLWLCCCCCCRKNIGELKVYILLAVVYAWGTITSAKIDDDDSDIDGKMVVEMKTTVAAATIIRLGLTTNSISAIYGGSIYSIYGLSASEWWALWRNEWIMIGALREKTNQHSEKLKQAHAKSLMKAACESVSTTLFCVHSVKPQKKILWAGVRKSPCDGGKERGHMQK